MKSEEGKNYLRRDDNKLSRENDAKLAEHKRFTGEICKKLLQNTYDPADTIDLLLNNVRNNEVKRIFYSEISKVIFSSKDESEKGQCITNSGELFEAIYIRYTKGVTHKNEKEKAEDNYLLNTAMKIHDHLTLAVSQRESFDNKKDIESINDNIENAKSDMSTLQNNISKMQSNMSKVKRDIKEAQRTLKNQETQHVTILGIFASVVMAFFGGLGFSSSILASIHLSSIYRIVLITSILALALTTVIYFLIRFMAFMNNKEFDIPEYKTMVWILSIILILDVLAWCIDRHFILGDIFYLFL